MAYILIEDRDAIKWLQTIIKNSLNQEPTARALVSAYNEIKAWDDALANPMTDAEILRLDVVSQHVKNEVAKIKKPPTKRTTSKRTKRTKKEDVDPYTCNDHPTYKGTSQRPRTDCDTCWNLYKSFNALEYSRKRRDFEVRQKRSAS